MVYMYDNFMIHVKILIHGAFGRTDRSPTPETTKMRQKPSGLGVFFCDFFPRLMGEIKSSPFQHMGFKNRVFIGKLATYVFLLFGRDQCHGKVRVIYIDR